MARLSELAARATEILSRLGRRAPNLAWGFLSRFQHRGSATRKLTAIVTHPLRYRDVRVVGGRMAGMKINLGGSYLRYLTGDVEPEVQETLSRYVKTGDVVYDLGANIGFFAIMCSRLVGEAGKVYAFEPMPDNVKILRHNLALNKVTNVEVVERAVSGSSGTAELFLSPWSAAHSLNVEGASKKDNRGEEAGSIIVATTALDDFAGEDGVRVPDFVKLDVEGAEVLALEGMRAIMTSRRPLLMCELHGTEQGVREFVASIDYDVRTLDEDSPKYNPVNAHMLAWPAGQPPQ
ncbi:MAG TPA: FkbM family methyltransferase [Solirubrobacteraceae bacterium]|jgi:FkbM family methyltransferase|nr:FkbM family methyltransferase [Solirubrobacteraceae bacterium]